MRQMRVVKWCAVLAAVFAVAACDDKGGAKTEPSATTSAKTTAKTDKSGKADHSGHAATSASAATSGSAAASASAAPSADPAAIAAAEAEREKAHESLRSHHRHHHHGGFAMFIHMAVDSLGLPEADKAKVEAIQKKLHEALAPSRAASHDVMAALADQVAAGKIDDAKIKPLVAKQDAAAAKVHDAVVVAVQELHDALKPEQRQALVDKVRAHAESWKKVNHEEEHGAKDKDSHLGHMKERYKLTDDQVEKISAALKKDAPKPADWEEVKKHIEAFETEFVKDKFDAKALTTANAANAHISKNGTARFVRFVEIVTPLLTPEQQKQFAEHLKERLNDPHAAK